jgi:hypothetical protein
MGQMLAIGSHDFYEPRVRSRDAIAAALAANLITTTTTKRSIPMYTFVPDGTPADDYDDVPAGPGEPE